MWAALVVENKNQRYWDVEGLLSQADWARYFDVLSLPQASASPLVRILRVNYLLGQYHNIEICTDKEFDDKQEAIVVLKEHNTEYNYPGKEVGFQKDSMREMCQMYDFTIGCFDFPKI